MHVEQFQRTRENWTWGIVNIPLLYGHDNRLGVNPKTIIRKVAHNARCYSKPYYALDKSQRYLWYEQDTHDPLLHEKVLALYKDLGVDVYWHYTMKGFHYITLHLMPRYEYETFINRLKAEFDNGSFYYSLRIIPNKWTNETYLWRRGNIENNGSGDMEKLHYIRKAMSQDYKPYTNYSECANMLDNMFCLSRYSFSKRLRT